MFTDEDLPATKIEKLTPEQRSQLRVYRNKWIEIGLSTKPADRPRAEAAIHQMYELVGLKPPKKIIWCKSPLGMMLSKSLYARFGAEVIDEVRAEVIDEVRDEVRAEVRYEVRDEVWDEVWAEVGAEVKYEVRYEVWAEVGAQLSKCGYGQNDANWLAFYDFFRDVAQLEEETHNLSGLLEQAKSAGWYLPYKNICWVSERPNILERDEEHRLHCASGPALAYPDGWGLYRWHGVKVPKFVIERPNEITVKTIDEEQNAEIRRVMLERFGLERYIRESENNAPKL